VTKLSPPTGSSSEGAHGQRTHDPPGIILCAEASRQRIEVLQLAGRGIHIGKYLTALPPRKLLEQRLRQAVELARARFGTTPQGRKRGALQC